MFIVHVTHFLTSKMFFYCAIDFSFRVKIFLNFLSYKDHQFRRVVNFLFFFAKIANINKNI